MVEFAGATDLASGQDSLASMRVTQSVGHGLIGKLTLTRGVKSTESQAVTPRSECPIEFPSARYGPNRIQTIDSEYEVTLKQFLAHILRWWGYEVALSDDEIKQRLSFAKSSGTRTPSTTYVHKERYFSWGLGGYNNNQFLSERTEAVKFRKCEEYLPVNIPEQYNYTYLTHHDAVTKMSSGYGDPKESIEHIQEVILRLKTPYSVKHSNQEACIHTALAGIDPRVSHMTFWISGRADPVDNLFLKMIRSRKGILADALAMIAADIKWRDEFKPTKLLLRGDANWFFSNPNSGIIRNFSGRKCWIRGTDLVGNLLFLFKVNRHHASDATPQEMKDWCILHIEWARLMMREISTGNDCAAVFFDMTGFSLKNIDYFTVKFIAETLEAHYPECLAYIMIYNAPWIFQTCWNVIKGWLDPVVASKVKFVKSKSELSAFINLKSLPKCMGGENEYDGEFTEPRPEDMKPPKLRDKKYYELIYERHRYHLIYLERTKRWIESTDPNVSAMYLRDKIDLSIQIAQNYIEIDPYIRRRGWYDRNGMLQLAL